MHRVRHPNRRQIPGAQQASQCHGIAPVGLDPLARSLWHQRGRNHDAVVTQSTHLAVKPIPRRARFIAEIKLFVAAGQLSDHPLTSPRKCLRKRSPSSRRRRRRCRTASGRSPAPPPRRARSARSRRRSAITARWPGSLSTATGSGRSSPRRIPISRRTDGSAVHRRLLLGGFAATVVGASLSAHGHEAPGAGRDREAADAAAPAFGTVIDFELTDAGGNRVRAVDLRGRWLLIFFGYTSCPDLCPTTLNEIAGALAQLGPLAARVQPIFVSVDPQRDTPQALR